LVLTVGIIVDRADEIRELPDHGVDLVVQIVNIRTRDCKPLECSNGGPSALFSLVEHTLESLENQVERQSFPSPECVGGLVAHVHAMADENWADLARKGTQSSLQLAYERRGRLARLQFLV
jgi:hypothetical protein